MFKSITCRAGIAAQTALSAGRCTLLGVSMPLRAKLPAGQLAATSRNMSNDSRTSDSVVFQSKLGLRTVELNRPQKLNSLNKEMIGQILPRLVEWEKSDMANVVVIKGAGERAFCAGGDVVALAQKNQEEEGGWQEGRDYFAEEYRLDHFIATYQKPFISFMDGITMGGGVGLSIHSPFRIATERTVFAMPETTIGLFPDVGASFFLPRMNGSVGTYLALTSERLHGANVLYSGVATHYLHSTNLRSLEERLAEIRFRDYDDMKTRLALVNNTIEEFTTGLPHDEPILLQGELREAIDRCFCHNTVEDIIAALEKEGGNMKEWAAQTLATLSQRSPLSVHVTLRQMRASRGWSIAETFQKEHVMAVEFMKNSDFNEGVIARLVNKKTPKWSPETLGDITKAGRDVTHRFFNFEAVEPAERLQLLTNRDYYEYPHAYLGVPNEAEVMKEVLAAPEKGQVGVAEEIINKRRGRQGISQVVWEILQRKTTMARIDGNDVVRWID